jgi:hypothetical protein
VNGRTNSNAKVWLVLSDFSAVVAELEALDPVSCAVRSSSRGGGSVPYQLLVGRNRRFAGGDGDQISGEEQFQAGNDFTQTIQ